nr:flagellin [Sulfurospirillum sp.]
RMDADSEDPRNIGLQNALSQLDHILDHVTKEHTKIGAYSNALGDANERAEYLSLNVKTVRSSVIDVDTAEAYLQFNQISNSYQAMLSTIAKINSMSLLNYM